MNRKTHQVPKFKSESEEAPCAQQIVGSPFMTTLNGHGDTVAGVAYTVIETRYDEVVTPYPSAFLSGPAVGHGVRSTYQGETTPREQTPRLFLR